MVRAARAACVFAFVCANVGARCLPGTEGWGVPGRTMAAQRRIAGLPEGEMFDPEDVDRSVDRLTRTGAFATVTLREAEVPNPDGTLDMELEVTDAKPRRFGFGAELSSLEGVTLSTFWLHRNLLGGAESLRVEGEVSGIGGDSGGTDYRLGTRFERPATFNADTNFYALAEIEQQAITRHVSLAPSTAAEIIAEPWRSHKGLIKNRQDDDWTFVFMGSNQDSYGEGAKVGFVGGNVQNYESSSAGVNYAFAEFSRGTSSFRSKPRRQRIADKERFFEDIKAAEEAMDDKD